MTSRRRVFLFAVVCVGQLALAVSGIARHELVMHRGTRYRFQTAPVDPVDLFRGRYVQLDFRAGTVPLALPADHDGRVYAVLGVDDRGFARITDLRTTPPPNADYLHVRASPAARPWTLGARSAPPDGPAPEASSQPRTRLDLPFDRYYMEESAAQRTERRYRERMRDPDAPPAYAVVHVYEGDAVLVDLKLGD